MVEGAFSSKIMEFLINAHKVLLKGKDQSYKLTDDEMLIVQNLEAVCNNLNELKESFSENAITLKEKNISIEFLNEERDLLVSSFYFALSNIEFNDSGFKFLEKIFNNLIKYMKLFEIQEKEFQNLLNEYFASILKQVKIEEK